MNPDFYERAYQRILWLTVWIGVAGSFAILFARGVRPAAGFLLGSAISLANFQALRGLVSALGGSPAPRLRGAAALVAVRYLLIGGAVYAIVGFLGVTLAAVLVGLLAAFGAVILEVFYELILYART